MSKHPNSLKGCFEIPIAERKMAIFPKGDFVDSSFISEFAESIRAKRVSEKLDKTSIIATECTSLYQITDMFPVCQYYCSDKSQLQPTNFLNNCIDGITVAIVKGKKLFVHRRKIKEELLKYETLCWYTTPLGEVRIICSDHIFKFLLHTPKLEISSEGVLIFYTSDQILATTDCEHYAWVYFPEEVKDLSIQNIESSEAGYSTVNFLKRSIDKENCTIEDTICPYKLSFDVDLLNSGGIHTEFKKL